MILLLKIIGSLVLAFSINAWLSLEDKEAFLKDSLNLILLVFKGIFVCLSLIIPVGFVIWIFYTSFQIDVDEYESNRDSYEEELQKYENHQAFEIAQNQGYEIILYTATVNLKIPTDNPYIFEVEVETPCLEKRYVPFISRSDAKKILSEPGNHQVECTILDFVWGNYVLSTDSQGNSYVLEAW